MSAAHLHVVVETTVGELYTPNLEPIVKIQRNPRTTLLYGVRFFIVFE